MAKGNNGLITADQAKAAGTALGECCTQLAAVSDIEAAQGAVVGSMYRLQAMAEIAKVLNTPAVEAMIMFAADAGAIEVAGNVRGDQVLSVSKQAVTRGYLLADAAGPQFAIISGKGGASFLVKEAGHRHRLRERGATQIKASAAALRVEPRANAVGKHDMLLIGEASCVLDGELFTVRRDERMPIRLSCYESDGPDGHEAKARRRLIRDLWLTISGEEPAGEMMEPEQSDSFDRPVTMIEEPQGPSAAGPSPMALFEAVLNDLRPIAAKKMSKEEAQRIGAIVDGLKDAKTVAEVDKHCPEIDSMLDGFSDAVRAMVDELIQYRRQILGGE
jgi:hypothetical protein